VPRCAIGAQSTGKRSRERRIVTQLTQVSCTIRATMKLLAKFGIALLSVLLLAAAAHAEPGEIRRIRC